MKFPAAESIFGRGRIGHLITSNNEQACLHRKNPMEVFENRYFFSWIEITTSRIPE